LKQIYLGLAIHNHQPVGNFPWVFEQVYHDAYLPMIDALERHPSIRLSVHYSGVLLDWLQANRPELLRRIRQMVGRKQVEIMTGGYYEPILPAIPDADKLGQIEKMSAAIQDYFGYSPSGFWLAERVWEPHLPLILGKAGVRWTVVDDTHFRLAGLGEAELFGYYITEEQGKTLGVFATSKHLRYLIPWHDVQEVIAFSRDQATEDGTKIAVMGDDGEKFGGWPGTYQHCWQDGWMESLFRTLEENSGWLKTIPLGEYARSFPALGRIYLPCASYDEMGEWALPSAKSREFSKLRHVLEREGRQDVTQYMHGGFWRNFMVKYPEVNIMHKKMLRTHDKVYRARQVSPADCGLDELWQGQCNCPYWHGVFGGIYMTDIRAATYCHLIRAENRADNVLRNGNWVDYEETDFDGDGEKEVLIDSDTTSLYLDPARGGSIFEWDLRHKNYNLATVLSRRPEAYHHVLLGREKPRRNEKKVATIHAGIQLKEKGLRRALHYDRYLRACMLDHFLDDGVTLRRFISGTYREMGDFIEQPYHYKLAKNGNKLRLLLEREAYVRYKRRLLPFKLAKELLLESAEPALDVKYTLTNMSSTNISSIFGTEWNINLLGGGHSSQAYYAIPVAETDDYHFDSTGELLDINQLVLGNRRLGIEIMLKLTRKLKLWRFPVEAICNSESGLEKVYQGSCVLLALPFNLSPGESLHLGLNWRTTRQENKLTRCSRPIS
jgi:hypothetical protein